MNRRTINDAFPIDTQSVTMSYGVYAYRVKYGQVDNLTVPVESVYINNIVVVYQ